MIGVRIKELVADVNGAMARLVLARAPGDMKEREADAWLTLEELAFEILNGRPEGPNETKK